MQQTLQGEACRLGSESQLADGWKEARGTAGLGRSVSQGWLCTCSELDTFRYFRGFRNVREEAPTGPQDSSFPSESPGCPRRQEDVTRIRMERCNGAIITSMDSRV